MICEHYSLDVQGERFIMKDFVIWVLVVIAFILFVGLCFGPWYIIEICLESRGSRKLRHEEQERIAEQEKIKKLDKEKKTEKEKETPKVKDQDSRIELGLQSIKVTNV